MAAIGIVLLLVLGVAVPVFSASPFIGIAAPTSTPTPVPGDVIPLESIEGLTSLNATVKINVNGLIDGKRAQGGPDRIADNK